MPETSTLPSGWVAKVDATNRRVYYISGGKSTFDHPTFGMLPKPWQLRLEGSGQHAREYYYNTDTQEKTSKNPRFGKKELQDRLMSIPRELRESATVTKNTTGLLEKMRRPPLSHVNNRHRYEIVHTIDPGSEAQGAIGGMNGGVFVVRIKGAGKSRLDVEKRFTANILRPFSNGKPGVGVTEILITRKLIHPALANAIDAFIAPNLQNPQEASLYLEFCDRGSLKDLIEQYAMRIGTREEALVPERFVWHALIGLCDGLSYLYGGRSFATDKNARYDPQPLPNWAPILHRDMKPDNILIRSRSTINSIKYPYLVISDFGLAGDDPDDIHQKSGSCMGTAHFFAPELLHRPWPRDGEAVMWFPKGQRHSLSSDLYGLGLCIYNLCRPFRSRDSDDRIGAFSHMNFSTSYGIPKELWIYGTISRISNTQLDIGGPYSDQLRKVLRKATSWAPVVRGAAHDLAPQLVGAAERAGFTGEYPSPPEMLPAWSTRIHSYNAL